MCPPGRFNGAWWYYCPFWAFGFSGNQTIDLFHTLFDSAYPWEPSKMSWTLVDVDGEARAGIYGPQNENMNQLFRFRRIIMYVPPPY